MKLLSFLVLFGLGALCLTEDTCFECPLFSEKKEDCPQSFADCQCDPASVRNETAEKPCTCIYKCPGGSQRKDANKCPASFDDCGCKRGYFRVDGLDSCCKESDFKCPALSKPRPGACPQSLDDCECDSTTSTRNETAEDLCECRYTCPSGWKANSTTECPHDLEWCTCEDNLEIQWDGIMKKCCYACPRFSTNTTECPQSFGDCQCGPASTRKNESKACECDYMCPRDSDSERRYEHLCPVSFDDCDCKNKGFKVLGVVEKCCKMLQCPPNSMAVDKNKCPETFNDCECAPNAIRDTSESTCRCEYTCPAFSESNSDFLCPVDFKNCTCNEEYVKKGDRCECPFTCPSNSQSKVGVGHCAKSMDDCKCDAGYEKRANTCVACAFQCPENSASSNPACTSGFADCICDTGYIKSTESDECIVPWNKQDTILFGTIFVACGFLWFLAWLAARCTRREFTSLVPLIFAFFDLLTDVLFGVDLLSEGGEAFAAAAFCIVALTLVTNIFLSCRLVRKFRQRELEEPSLATWLAETDGSDNILGIYLFLSMFTVESLLIACSKIFDKKMFSVPLNRKQRRLVVGYAVANNFVEDIPQLVIVVASRFVLEKPWSLIAVLNVAFTITSILYFLIIRMTTLVAVRSNWLDTTEPAADIPSAKEIPSTKEIPSAENNTARSVELEQNDESNHTRTYPSFFTTDDPKKPTTNHHALNVQ